MPPATLGELAAQLRIPASKLAGLPGALPHYSSIFNQPMATYRMLDETLFQEIGHHRTAAAAPSSEQLTRDFARAYSDGASHASTMLGVVATLAHCHPNLPASLNRAITIMESWKERGIIEAPSDRTLLSAWKNWRHVAPIWTAFRFEVKIAATSGLSELSATLEAMHNPIILDRVLGHAKWFRRFGTTFIPDHGSAPLIPPSEAVEIIARSPEQTPPLIFLDEADLEAARRHQAPTRKFFGLG